MNICPIVGLHAAMGNIRIGEAGTVTATKEDILHASSSMGLLNLNVHAKQWMPPNMQPSATSTPMLVLNIFIPPSVWKKFPE
jgi:hypothetical protein